MGQVIGLLNGEYETVSGLDDFIRMVDEHLGSEARECLEDYLAEQDEDADYIRFLEQENQKLRDHHHEVMQELRESAEWTASLIREKEIDRKALSTVAGKIGKITWREINVR